MDDMMRFNCVFCGKKMKTPFKFQGRKINCTGCKQSMVVPAAETSAAANSNSKEDRRWKYPSSETIVAKKIPATPPAPPCSSDIAEEVLFRKFTVQLVLSLALGIVVSVGTAKLLDATIGIITGFCASLALLAILPIQWAWKEMEANGGIYAFETAIVEHLAGNWAKADATAAPKRPKRKSSSKRYGTTN